MSTDDGALFGVDELRDSVQRTGKVEAGCWAAIKAGADAGIVIDVDAGLAAAALAAARRLDEADAVGIRYGDLKAGYLTAQLLTPYRELLQAMRLPAEVAPAEEPRGPQPPTDGAVPAWLDGFAGSAE